MLSQRSSFLDHESWITLEPCGSKPALLGRFENFLAGGRLKLAKTLTLHSHLLESQADSNRSLCENEKRFVGGNRDRESCFWTFWELEYWLLGFISFVPGLYLMLFLARQPRAIVAFERMRAGISGSRRRRVVCSRLRCRTAEIWT